MIPPYDRAFVRPVPFGTFLRVTSKTARVITEVFSPGYLVAALLLLVAWHASDTLGQALVFGLIAAVAAGLLPVLYILIDVRRGRLSDKHVIVHSQRRMPMLVILGSTAAGTAALALTGAPRELLALIGSMVLSLLVAVPITIFGHWGVSFHALVAAGAVAALVVVFGPLVHLGWVVVVAIAWARVELTEHTPAQVVVGALIGAAAMGFAFPLLA